MEIDPKDVGQDYSDEFTHQEEFSKSEASSNDTSDLVEDGEQHVSTIKYHEVKWKRLRKLYRDQYLELFDKNCRDDPGVDERFILLDSQVGAVSWTVEEKKKFFIALAKVGRHDLLQLSKAVTTKSQAEVAAYIDAIRDAEIDRQLFMKNPKNISLVDIPAAIEISADCDQALEQAADALGAYQEQYDVEAGQKIHGLEWLIDRETAEEIDTKVETSEADSSSQDDENETHVAGDNLLDAHKIFKLTNFLDLSEQFFMNHSDQSLRQHWKDVVEAGQRPALTKETVQDMFNLVVEHTQKVLRTSLHVAQARLADLTKSNYGPSQSLRRSDIVAALDILDLPHDAWEFWTKLAQRNDLQVITGSHSRGESRHQSIPYEEVEATLAARRGRGGRRSMSIGKTSSADGRPSDVDDIGLDDISDAGAAYVQPSEEDDESGDDLSIQSESDYGGILEEADSLHSRQAQTLSATKAFHNTGSRVVVGLDQRQMLSEEAQETFAEKVDQVASAKEEELLWQVLGKRPVRPMENEDEQKLEPRPRRMRKTREDIKGWSCAYQSEWESFGYNVADAASRINESEFESSRDDDAVLS